MAEQTPLPIWLRRLLGLVGRRTKRGAGARSPAGLRILETLGYAPEDDVSRLLSREFEEEIAETAATRRGLQPPPPDRPPILRQAEAAHGAAPAPPPEAPRYWGQTTEGQRLALERDKLYNKWRGARDAREARKHELSDLSYAEQDSDTQLKRLTKEAKDVQKDMNAATLKHDQAETAWRESEIVRREAGEDVKLPDELSAARIRKDDTDLMNMLKSGELPIDEPTSDPVNEFLTDLLDVPNVSRQGTRMPATTTAEGAVVQPPVRGGTPSTEHRAAIVTPGKEPAIVQAVDHMSARMAARDEGLLERFDAPGVIEGFVREGKLVDDAGIPITRAQPGRTGYSTEDIAEQKKTISTLSRLLEQSPQVRGAIGPEGRLWSGGPWWAAAMGTVTAADVVRRIDEDPLTRVDEPVQVQVGRPDGDAHDNVYAGIAADVVRTNEARDLDIGTISQQHIMERVLNLREPEPFDLPEVSVENVAVKPDVTATPTDFKRLQEHLAARNQPTIGAATVDMPEPTSTTARGESMAKFIRGTPINAAIAGAYEGTGYAATMLNGLVFGIPYLLADDKGKAAIREKVGASPITRYANTALDVMEEARATGDIGIAHEAAMLGGDILAGYGLGKLGPKVSGNVRRVVQEESFALPNRAPLPEMQTNLPVRRVASPMERIVSGVHEPSTVAIARASGDPSPINQAIQGLVERQAGGTVADVTRQVPARSLPTRPIPDVLGGTAEELAEREATRSRAGAVELAEIAYNAGNVEDAASILKKYLPPKRR